MTLSHETTRQEKTADYAAEWDLDMLRRNWTDYLITMTKDCDSPIPYKRIQFQVEQSTVYQQTIKRWPKMNASERRNAWKSLLESSEQVVHKVLPTCVQCGECCRRGSPTLHSEDLELLHHQKIPWDQLLTLRQGEPVRTPFEEKLVFLPEERIKIREKAGTQECFFLDSTSDECLIYANRPVQCRAQACWSPTAAKQQANQPYLTREEIFSGVELLLDMIDEHDRRCNFSALSEAFERLQESRGETIGEVLRLLAYEDHFRHFLRERMNIPENTLDLLFGRSFSDLVPIFGFQVRHEPDGTRCLIPDEPQ